MLDVGTFLSPHGMAVLFLTGAYPVITYLPFVFGGMAVGRLDLRRPDVAVRLVTIGAESALLLLGYGGSWLVLHPFGGLGHILASVPANSLGLSADQLFDGWMASCPPRIPRSC